jgi:hypothetical protein
VGYKPTLQLKALRCGFALLIFSFSLTESPRLFNCLSAVRCLPPCLLFAEKSGGTLIYDLSA